MGIKELNRCREELASTRDIIMSCMEMIKEELDNMGLPEQVVRDISIQGSIIRSALNKQLEKLDRVLVRELLRYVEEDSGKDLEND